MKKTGRLTPTKYCRVVIHTGGAHQATCVVWGEDVENEEVPFTEDHVEFFLVSLDDAGVCVQEVKKVESLPPDMNLESLTVFKPLHEAGLKRNVMKALEAKLQINLIYKG